MTGAVPPLPAPSTHRQEGKNVITAKAGHRRLAGAVGFENRFRQLGEAQEIDKHRFRRNPFGPNLRERAPSQQIHETGKNVATASAGGDHISLCGESRQGRWAAYQAHHRGANIRRACVDGAKSRDPALGSTMVALPAD